MKKLIILDRDGVINEDCDNYIRSAQEWIPIPGSIDAIAKLSKAGYLVAVATNQSGLARGYFTKDDLTNMHSKMLKLISEAGGEIKTIKFCPHHPKEKCKCRKPKGGLIIDILEELKVSPEDTWVVGDTLKDIQAGKSAGCKTALVKTGKGLKNIHEKYGSIPTSFIFDNLSAFCKRILTKEY